MRLWKSVVLFAVAALAVQPGIAWAQYETSTGSVELSDTSPAPGESVTVAGDGFAPGSEVTATIESSPRTLATVNADGNGAFSVTVAIPSDMEPGTHTLKATGITPDGATRVLASTVTVSGGGQAPARDASLAVTGGSVAGLVGLVGLGVGSVGVGLVLTRARRRRA